MEDVLAEDFAAFQVCRLGGGAEDADPGRSEGIDQTAHQWRFRADDHEVNRVFSNGLENCVGVGRRNRQIGGMAGGAGIAWGDEDIPPITGEFPGEGILATAAPDHQNSFRTVHGASCRHCWFASARATPRRHQQKKTRSPRHGPRGASG